MNIFYVEPEHVFGNQFELTGQEATHASKALRLKEGDKVHATDGRGRRYLGTVHSITKKTLVAVIDETEEVPQSHPEITLAMGIIKKRDRLEFALEKAVELGAAHIIFFRADHTEKTNVRLDRLESIAQSAMKQSLRAWLPSVSMMDSLEDVLQAHTEHKILMAHEKVSQENTPPDTEENHQKILLLIGPEGGFSPEEVEMVNSEGGETVSLGGYRLRAETAAISFLSRYIS